MKGYLYTVYLIAVICMITSCCGTPVCERRADDPYLYQRGGWNTSRGGILDDIPQYCVQMVQSMFDFGQQPIDPPSEYAAGQ